MPFGSEATSGSSQPLGQEEAALVAAVAASEDATEDATSALGVEPFWVKGCGFGAIRQQIRERFDADGDGRLSDEERAAIAEEFGSPLDRVGQLIRITHDARLAQWVCEQADGFFIRNPHNLPPTSALIPATNDIVQEFADMLATIAQAAGDNAISKDEAKTIRRRWEELKSVTEGFVQAAESGNFGPPKMEIEPRQG